MVHGNHGDFIEYGEFGRKQKNSHTKGKTILLVEDDRPLLEFFSAILRREGHEVLTAQNGLEALEIAKSRPDERIDILLSDVAMPYMGGVRLAVNLLWRFIRTSKSY